MRADAERDAIAKCEILLNNTNDLMERSNPVDRGPVDKRRKVSRLPIEKMRRYRRQAASVSEISVWMAIPATTVYRWVKNVEVVNQEAQPNANSAGASKLGETPTASVTAPVGALAPA